MVPAAPTTAPSPELAARLAHSPAGPAAPPGPLRARGAWRGGGSARAPPTGQAPGPCRGRGAGGASARVARAATVSSGTARAMASPGFSAPGGVAVVGSGLIGRSWAMLFASAGFSVKLFDIEPRQVTDALVSLRKEMKMLELSGYLKGELGAEEQLSLISGCSDLREAVEGALHVQECVPENLELKRKLFAQLDKIADDHVILSSSSSCLLPSKLFAGLAHVKQCLVAHPVNPPYYVPLVELVPHPETAPATVDRTYALMQRVGQSPVRLLREVDGFALNRLQYAVIAEAWRLVEEGVVSPGDLDLVMSDGLGLRYAFIGPLETMHLNAEGMLSYCDRYSEGMKRVLKTFGPVPEFSGATAEKVHQAMCVKVPDDAEHLAARRAWRDGCLMRLAQLKRQLPQ
ncbi:lambda-crystallin homolog [Oryx dammah]|uniref:lambda-crystallin homolog n=1 Tax=Oryx dammah TaxID=59534 RepID=UPI001A9ACC27|nr:lambda-crystallin homolog [Oryx dammah]